MIRFVRLLVATLLAGMLLSGPSHLFASTSTSTSKSHTAAKPTPSDAQIDSTIRAKLAKSKIGKDGLKFHVQRGVVTWEGSTNVMQHKGSATRMAKSAGASAVVNNIQVSGAAKAKAAANLKKASVSE